MPRNGCEVSTCRTVSSFSKSSSTSSGLGAGVLAAAAGASLRSCVSCVTTWQTRLVISSINLTFLILSSSTVLALCSVIMERKSGSRVLNLSFSLGVRSPCRVRATTHSSSALGGVAKVRSASSRSAAPRPLRRRPLSPFALVRCAGASSGSTSWLPSGCARRCAGAIASSMYCRSRLAESDQNLCESLTKLQPLTSHTYVFPLERSRSKPHTVCPKVITTLRAITFSSASRITG
mmetsp:Transcript_16239/g.41401  ORF Transcript_16239/g.41401 Transcript_16239/m.41401 type:complete len:235 (+) Transcript_16239:898-1602(+)